MITQKDGDGFMLGIAIARFERSHGKKELYNFAKQLVAFLSEEISAVGINGEK